MTIAPSMSSQLMWFLVVYLSNLLVTLAPSISWMLMWSLMKRFGRFGPKCLRAPSLPNGDYALKPSSGFLGAFLINFSKWSLLLAPNISLVNSDDDFLSDLQ